MIKKIYGEIKDLQESMMWNLDISKMQELGYVQVLVQIQDRFKEMCISLDVDKQNEEIWRNFMSKLYDILNFRKKL